MEDHYNLLQLYYSFSAVAEQDLSGAGKEVVALRCKVLKLQVEKHSRNDHSV